MKMRFHKSIALLLACCLLGLTGCTEKLPLFQELTNDDIQSWKTSGDKYTQSEGDLGLSNMQKVATSGGATLYYHPKTAEIAVQDADGTVWYSNPQNRASFNQTIVGKYSSQLIVNIINFEETSKTLFSFSDCVTYGQFAMKKISGGIRVTYNFGRVVPKPIYPEAITQERYDEILEQLDASEQKNFKSYYRIKNYKTIADPQIQNQLKETYTKIEELGVIYTLIASPSGIQTKRLTEYFTKIGYTEHNREADHAAVGFAEVIDSSGNFSIPVEYTLEKGSLRATIPSQEITATADIKIESLVLLPYFNTKAGMENSQAFIPDGSGALMELSKLKSANISDYEENFYGKDYSLYQASQISNKYNLYFPLYSVMNGDGAFYGVVEQADATASIYATARTGKDEYGSVGFKFKLLDYAKVKLLETDTSTVKSYPDQYIGDTISAVYRFLPAKSNTWTAVATAYREQLLKEKTLIAKKADKVPVVVNYLGAFDDVLPILGIPKEIIVPMTTYSQAMTLTKSLQQMYSGNDLVIRYTGWRKGGIKSSAANSVKTEPVLGKPRDFAALADYLEQNNIAFFPDMDFQYVYRDRWFDGFSKSNDVARFIISEAAYKPQYSPSSFTNQSYGLFGYVLKSSKMLNFAEAFLKQNFHSSGVTLPYMASELSGDYDKKTYLTRNAAKGSAGELLDKIGGQYDILSSGANQYALSALDIAVEVPVESNAHPLLDRTVPFLQMVLSGSVTYTAPELNTTADVTYYTLKCIETGSALYFSTMAADNSVVKNTNYEGYFAVNFDMIRERAQGVGNTVIEALTPVYGQAMVNHRIVAEGVIRVDYENGKSVLVNYNDADTTVDGITIAKHSYAHAEWR